MTNLLSIFGQFFRIMLWISILDLSTEQIWAAAIGNKYEIYGIVVDSVTDKTIPYATISIQDSTGIIKRLASDANGKFSCTVDSSGKFNVIIQAIGYQSFETQVKTDEINSSVNLGKISLTPGSEEIGEVVVVAQKPLIRTEVDKIVYSIEADPESKTSNALEMLRKVPLVTVDGEDNIQVKGTSNFRILLNGKSSSMLSQNPKDVLRSMPATSVKDIEVITNPSSKYEAEGTGGIINIITTRKQIQGFLGRVNAGINSMGGYNLGIYASSKIRKFGFSLNYNLNQWRQPKSEYFSDMENYLSTPYRYTSAEGDNKTTGNFSFLNGEASYEFDSLNLVSLSFWGYKGDYAGNGMSVTRVFDTEHGLTREFSNATENNSGWGFLSGNIDYQKTFKKPDKSLTVSYKIEAMPDKSDFESDISGRLNYESNRQRSSNDASVADHTFQLDYFDPLTSMHQVEGGVKYVFRHNISNSNVLRYDSETDGWVADELRKSDLTYDQHVLGLYGGYVLKLKKISFKTGLRAEETMNRGFFKSARDTTFINQMFNLVPYLTLSRELNKGQNVSLSYTQKLSRPGIWLLNPYINDSDPLNINYGNPDLDAEVSHTFSFTYGRFSGKLNLNLSLNASITDNAIQSVSSINPTGVRSTTYKNIGKTQQYGGYLYGSYKPVSKLSINTNLGMNYSVLESNDSRNLRNEGLSYNGSLNSRYTAWKGGNLSFYAGYYSPDISLQGKSGNYWYSSLSISQELFKKKLTMSLSASNPFSRRFKFKNTFDDPTFHQEMTYYYYNRMIRFNLSYSFGQMKEEIKKARRGIKNDDVKGGGAASGATGGRTE